MTQSMLEFDTMKNKRGILKNSNTNSEALIRKSCFLFGGPINRNRKAKISIAGKFFEVLFDSKGKPGVVRK